MRRPTVTGILLLLISDFHTLAVASAQSAVAQPARTEVYNARARKLISAKQFQEAVTLLDRARKEEPRNSELLYLRGYALYELREFDKAREQFEEVARLNPPALRSCYFLGRIALLQAHPEAAIRWLKAPAQESTPVEDSPAQLGKAYLDAHQLPEARKWTERALRITPWDGPLHYRLARLYQQAGENDAAEKEFRASLELKVADRKAVEKLIAGSQEISRENFDAAREIRDSFLAQKQLDPDVLVALGSSFAAAGLPEDATGLFTEAAERDPSSFQAHFDLGLALLKMGRTGEAIEPLKAGLSIAPSSVECNAALGLGYVLLGEFEEALPPLELVHSVQPENPRTEGLLALTYLRTKAAAKAIPIVQASLAKQSDDPKLYFLLIECLNNAERQTEALTVAEQVVVRFPSLPKSHLAKAQQLARLGRYEEAGPAFTKAVQLAPQELEPLLGLAEVRNKSGAYAESLEIYRTALELDSKNLTAQLGSAKDLVALGKVSKAKELLETAAADHAGNSQVHFELSRVYARLGNRDQAARETEIVQQLRHEVPASNGLAR